jgi:hypothetical protein
MANLDPRNDAVVIRVVYDGAPMAGKSTSVRALGRGLGGEVVSPAEVGGRTLYFDWLDYTGGLFEGRRIRCQIISVPGQATLAPRRRRLLESADVIVFVGDSTPTGFAGDRSYLSGLQAVLERVSGPPVGIVFQANKRDHADAVPLDTVRSMLDELGLRVGVVESVATESSGIRNYRRVNGSRRTDIFDGSPYVDVAHDISAFFAFPAGAVCVSMPAFRTWIKTKSRTPIAATGHCAWCTCRAIASIQPVDRLRTG